MRIVIADDEPLVRMDLRETLEQAGHEVVAEAASGKRALDLVRQHRPDVAILDIRMPQMTGIAAAKAITRERLSAVVLLTAYSQKELVEQAKEAGVLAYVVKPFQESDVLPALEIARARFEEFRRLEVELGSVKEALETRKVVEKAKGILMEKQGITEAEAFNALRKRSMDLRRSMKEVAEAVVMAMGA